MTLNIEQAVVLTAVAGHEEAAHKEYEAFGGGSLCLAGRGDERADAAS